MNYEGFYDDLQPQQKNVKDGIASLQRLFKAVSREVEGGDVKNLAKDLETMAQAASAVSEAIDALRAENLRSRCLRPVRIREWMSVGSFRFMRCFLTV